jgi:hypothetical protein
MQQKKCVRCGILKSFDEFGKDSERKDGKKIYCKVCSAEKRLEYKYGTERKPNVILAEKIVKEVKEHKQGSKQCSKCKKEKQYSDYPRNAASKDKYAARCKTCSLEDVNNRKAKDINYAKFYYPIELD